MKKRKQWYEKITEREIKKLEELSDEEFMKHIGGHYVKGISSTLLGVIIIMLCVVIFILSL